MSGSPADSSENWTRLYEVAAAQGGYFTTEQAQSVGYSPQLLRHHVRAGRLERARRGIYRLVHFPIGEHEELVVAWLWSAQQGVVSHESALELHGLSDVLPAAVQLTVPVSWSRRRLRIPGAVVLSFAEVPENDRDWHGPVPITTVRRTLADCAAAGLSPEHLRAAARDALRVGAVRPSEIAAVHEALAPYGGIEP